MIESIQAGIIKALQSEFDPSMHEFYTESVEQGLTEPCFSILCLNPSIKDGLGTRHQRSYQFMIQYFPKSQDEPRTECLRVCDILFNTLDHITVDGVVVHHTDSMSGNVNGGVLSFQVTYLIHADIEHEKPDDMGNIEITRKVK